MVGHRATESLRFGRHQIAATFTATLPSTLRMNTTEPPRHRGAGACARCQTHNASGVGRRSRPTHRARKRAKTQASSRRTRLCFRMLPRAVPPQSGGARRVGCSVSLWLCGGNFVRVRARKYRSNLSVLLRSPALRSTTSFPSYGEARRSASGAKAAALIVIWCDPQHTVH
jgi:hypothetical protein